MRSPRTERCEKPSDPGLIPVYVTGVMQIDMAETAFCHEHLALCTSATHTYTQTVTITSPSGRKGSCTFSQKYPAQQHHQLSCQHGYNNGPRAE